MAEFLSFTSYIFKQGPFHVCVSTEDFIQPLAMYEV